MRLEAKSHEKFRNSLVLLVDEYDTPLTSCLNNPELFNSVQVALSDFYAVLKSNDDALRFVFITGIVNFNKGHLFSEVQELSVFLWIRNLASS